MKRVDAYLSTDGQLYDNAGLATRADRIHALGRHVEAHALPSGASLADWLYTNRQELAHLLGPLTETRIVEQPSPAERLRRAYELLCEGVAPSEIGVHNTNYSDVVACIRTWAQRAEENDI